MLCSLNSLASFGTRLSSVDPTLLSGKIAFNGAGNGYATVGNNFSLGTQFTFDAWVYMPASAFDGSYKCLYSTPTYSFGFNGTSWGMVFESVSRSYFSGTALSPNTWYHISIQRNSSSRIEVWVNGSLHYTSPSSESTTLNTSSGADLGRRRVGATSYMPNGSFATRIRLSTNIRRLTINPTTIDQKYYTRDGNTHYLLNVRSAAKYLTDDNDLIIFTNQGGANYSAGFP